MLQDILTYTIVALVSIYVFYKLIRLLLPSEKEPSGCGHGCSCDSVEKKNELLEAFKKKAGKAL